MCGSALSAVRIAAPASGDFQLRTQLPALLPTSRMFGQHDCVWMHRAIPARCENGAPHGRSGWSLPGKGDARAGVPHLFAPRERWREWIDPMDGKYGKVDRRAVLLRKKMSEDLRDWAAIVFILSAMSLLMWLLVFI
jgi:hypothetical protein